MLFTCRRSHRDKKKECDLRFQIDMHAMASFIMWFPIFNTKTISYKRLYACCAYSFFFNFMLKQLQTHTTAVLLRTYKLNKPNPYGFVKWDRERRWESAKNFTKRTEISKRARLTKMITKIKQQQHQLNIMWA